VSGFTPYIRLNDSTLASGAFFPFPMSRLYHFRRLANKSNKEKELMIHLDILESFSLIRNVTLLGSNNLPGYKISELGKIVFAYLDKMT
ncbi:MAG: hypothetical protein LBP19_05740, partial [Treponema sp.]|nr:hypothetical protein [Treponema sp.]